MNDIVSRLENIQAASPNRNIPHEHPFLQEAVDHCFELATHFLQKNGSWCKNTEAMDADNHKCFAEAYGARRWSIYGALEKAWWITFMPIKHGGQARHVKTLISDRGHRLAEVIAGLGGRRIEASPYPMYWLNDRYPLMSQEAALRFLHSGIGLRRNYAFTTTIMYTGGDDYNAG